MKDRFHWNQCRWAVWVGLAALAWQLMPDQYLGPYSAWNPHAIMEFVLIIFAISLMGKLAVQVFGSHYGLPLTGLLGGFASSTATIHSMGVLVKSQPELADRAGLAGVLSNVATLVQLVVLLQMLAPALLRLFIQPLCFGMVGMCLYAVWMWVGADRSTPAHAHASSSMSFDWQSLLTLTLLVCCVSYVSAALNAAYGQNGLWLAAAMSGLVDAHAIIPMLSSLIKQDKLSSADALMPMLVAFSANTLTKV